MLKPVIPFRTIRPANADFIQTRFFQHTPHTTPFQWSPTMVHGPFQCWTADIFAVLAAYPTVDPACIAPNYNADIRGKSNSDTLLMFLSTKKEKAVYVPMSFNDGWAGPEQSHEVNKSLPFIHELFVRRYPDIAAYAALHTNRPLPDKNQAYYETFAAAHMPIIEKQFGKSQTMHPITIKDIEAITAHVQQNTPSALAFSKQ